MQNNQIFIPGQVPSLKNSKVMGKFPSKVVQKWLRTFGIISYSGRRKEVKYFVTIMAKYNFYGICKPIKECKNYPIHLGFHFVRGSKGKWDFNNANHIITDLMTAFDIIPDDCVQYILPYPLEIDGEFWHYDKDNPGVILEILNKPI